MHRGYFRHWRKEVDSPLWQKPPLYSRVWYWLLGQASHQGNTHKRKLPPGTLTTTYSQMADAIQWEENNQVRIPDRKTLTRILEWMKTDGMIAIDTCHKRFTKITICNWATYQSIDDELVSSEGTREGTLFKNVNNEKKEETTKTLTWIGKMGAAWTEITGDIKPPYSIFNKWKKAYGEEMPLVLAEDLVLKGKKLSRSNGNTPEGYFVKALNEQLKAQSNGHPAKEFDPWTNPELLPYHDTDPNRRPG